MAALAPSAHGSISTDHAAAAQSEPFKSVLELATPQVNVDGSWSRYDRDEDRTPVLVHVHTLYKMIVKLEHSILTIICRRTEHVLKCTWPTEYRKTCY